MPFDAGFEAALARWWGRRRTTDCAHWRGVGARALAVDVRGHVVGGALVCPRTPWVAGPPAVRIGPLASARSDLGVGVALAVVRAAVGLAEHDGVLRVLLPEVHPAAEVLLGLGAAVVDRDTHVATDGAITDLNRLAGAADLW